MRSPVDVAERCWVASGKWLPQARHSSPGCGVMREAVEQRAGDPFGGEDANPFVKGQIAGHQGQKVL
jgi:hypothetical protein